YRLRKGSGGKGKQHGGDGVVREIETLVPSRMSLLCDRRKHGPYGLFGGEDGAVGTNTLNNKHKLPSKGSHELKPGDRIRIETPGGGGWGKSTDSADYSDAGSHDEFKEYYKILQIGN